MKRNKEWQRLEDYVAEILKEIDKQCRPSKGSGNAGESGDIKNNVGLHIECKQRKTKNVTINIDVWNKLKKEIPLHCDKLPVLCLENKDKKRFAVLNLNDFLQMFIRLYKKS